FRCLEQELRAAEERNRLARVVGDRGVPDLRRAASVNELPLTTKRAVTRGSEEVRLQLDGREARPPLRERGHAAVAADGVRERDDSARVEVAVRPQVLRTEREDPYRPARLELGHLEADEPGERRAAGLVERVEVGLAQAVLRRSGGSRLRRR